MPAGSGWLSAAQTASGQSVKRFSEQKHGKKKLESFRD
jgi:hypothetical protein